jgi:ABC-2 type transport system permease protein
MALTLVLVRLLGAARARIAAQVVGACTGAGFFLVMQARQLLGPHSMQRIDAVLVRWTAPEGPLGPDSLAWLPLRAGTGSLSGLVVLVLACSLAFWAVVQRVHDKMLSGLQQPRAGGSPARHAPRASTYFRAGTARLLLRKEWKLMVRDPGLTGNALMQMLYLVPLVLLALRDRSMLAVAVPAGIVVSAMLVSGLAWITVIAEEAPALLAGAPLSLAHVRRAKLFAALIPVWLLAAPWVVVLAIREPAAAGVLVTCLAGATASAALVPMWYPAVQMRGDAGRTTKPGFVLSMLESLIAAAWSGLATCLASHSSWGLLWAGVAVSAPAAAWFFGRERRMEGWLY